MDTSGFAGIEMDAFHAFGVGDNAVDLDLNIEPFEDCGEEAVTNEVPVVDDQHDRLIRLEVVLLKLVASILNKDENFFFTLSKNGAREEKSEERKDK